MKRVCSKCGNEVDIGKIWVRKGYSCCFDCMSTKPKKEKQINPIFESRNKVRKEVIDYIKLENNDSNHPLYNFIGCTPIELKNYLESKFTEGMTWNNRGYYGWHIDHIIPLCNAPNQEQLYTLCHFTNLRPLWRKDNLTKRNTTDKYYQLH
jgi:hypothetical protein